MKNLWTQRDFELAAWAADIRTIAADPSGLLSFLEQLIGLGEEHEVFMLGAGAADEVRRQWIEHQVVDCLLTRQRVAGARVAWYDRDGALVDGVVGDLGELLRTLLPAPGMIPDGLMERGDPPLKISSRKVAYSGVPPKPSLPGGELVISCSISTDIWFPFVLGSAHPWSDGRRYFDNRELAQSHTRRLNGFLAELKSLVIDLGGSWHPDDGTAVKALRPWIGPHGILLDGPVPELMPDAALDVPLEAWIEHWR